MKKILLAVILTLTALLSSCSLPGGLTLPFPIPSPQPTPDPIPDPIPDREGYLDPTHKSGTYKIEFVLATGSVIHYYEEGELPEPPAELDYENEVFTFSFLTWDTEIIPVTGDAKYMAKYEKTNKQYTATFIVGDRSIPVKANCGTAPTPPKAANYKGMQFACWDRPVESSLTDVTYTAVYTSLLSPERMVEVYNEPLSAYSSDFQTMHMAASYTALALQEHEMPLDGAVAARLASFLATFFDGEQGGNILFDARANWGFAGLTATFATVKDTPTVYNRLSYATRTRMDTFMRAVAYTVAFNMADCNGYKSGPGMAGNFGKDWNPNYRLGNIPCMPFLVHYFGVGDMDAGAKYVEELILGFDGQVYDGMIRCFSDYGWTTAYRTWTSPAPVENARDARTLLVEGGNATVHPDYKANGGGGGGYGVKGNGPFRYKG